MSHEWEAAEFFAPRAGSIDAGVASAPAPASSGSGWRGGGNNIDDFSVPQQSAGSGSSSSRARGRGSGTGRGRGSRGAAAGGGRGRLPRAAPAAGSAAGRNDFHLPQAHKKKKEQATTTKSKYKHRGGTITLDAFQGVVFVGGFSYADVLDSAKGWAATIKFNPKVWEQFQAFKARSDTFSLGVCNGCQLMALLGWIPKTEGMAAEQQPRFVHNTSGRFESRWSTVKIMESPSVLLAGMEGSSLGVWVAHGEGRAHFPDPASRKSAVDGGLAPVRFVDDSNSPTEAYPFNPNGSPDGIAGLCSEDGRHLAVMPHPERCFLKWQWPYMPKEWRDTLTASPWLKMFQNARQWCHEHPRQA